MREQVSSDGTTEMMTRGIVCVTGLLAALWLPMSVPAAAADSAATAKQRYEREAQAGSVEIENNGKKSDRQEVQSRGLFSKKKKKKPTGGGAAAHSQAPERMDSPKPMGEP